MNRYFEPNNKFNFKQQTNSSKKKLNQIPLNTSNYLSLTNKLNQTKIKQQVNMSCLRVIFFGIFTILQLAAIGLGIAAIALPQWIDPKTPGELYEDDLTLLIENAGLWQVCLGSTQTTSAISTLTNSTEIQSKTEQSFQQIYSKNCKSGKTVEKFYRNIHYFGNDMYTEFMATKALIIFFALFALIKFISIVIIKCHRESPGCGAVCYVSGVSLVEGGAAMGALFAYGTLREGLDTGSQDRDH
eukprot:TRINITY_DN2427_c0_g3_i1.p1 TRINITY_DN2427_c0_g3~~TRINITY_DN2427_c0_g3_i1.p1  ORF type:complete len:255 (+),score=14.72 TRINITY_DN2427_c0_g3_i1:37-765(+)